MRVRNTHVYIYMYTQYACVRMFCSKSTSDVLIKLPHLGLSSIVYFNFKKRLHIIWYSISSMKSNKGSMQNKFSVKVGILSQGGGGVWPNPNFYKALFLWHIWPFFAENFRKIHGKNPNVRGGGGAGSSRLRQNPNFYRKFVLEASLMTKCFKHSICATYMWKSGFHLVVHCLVQFFTWTY